MLFLLHSCSAVWFLQRISPRRHYFEQVFFFFNTAMVLWDPAFHFSGTDRQNRGSLVSRWWVLTNCKMALQNQLTAVSVTEAACSRMHSRLVSTERSISLTGNPSQIEIRKISGFAFLFMPVMDWWAVRVASSCLMSAIINFTSSKN